ncbi:mandelate racemase/muconate lactonizing enzyme family protein [Erythrobacter sp. W53]|uniref:mandelate racemase/muconate lactonizing enzyme family protein n=1 Tax=Erythrobacter sp. W53 TaxID=3425947 RepID=UPI003D766E1B
MSKISAIKSFPTWVGHRNNLLVKVETDDGLYGWGESGVSGRELAVVGAVDHFREFLLGQDARRIGAIWQELYRSAYFEGGRVLTGAISAIDMALWDIAGKRHGVPTYELFGGAHRDKIPCFPTCPAPTGKTLIEDTKALIADGWDIVRLTTGDADNGSARAPYDPSVDATQLAACLTELRQEVGPTVTLGVDMHHRLSVAQAASFAQRMPSGTIDFLEEPIRHQTPDAYEALRRMTDVPFAIGEECASKWDFRPFIERGITQFARIDVCNVGGLSEAMKIAAMAETHYIEIMPHDPLGPICTAATIQMCAAVPNLSWCEIAPYGGDKSDHDRIFVNRPVEKDRFYAIPTLAGLGVDVREDELETDFRFWEAPRRYRPDGSFNNW